MDIVPSPNPIEPIPEPSRPLAEVIKKEGKKMIFVDAMGKKMTQRKYFAIMLWDAIVQGQLTFADGRVLRVGSMKDWTELVKMLTDHVDGPVNPDVKVQVANVFKVYQGIDETQV